ncbi:NAD(+) diphosphatase [Bifidobacterium sp. ESL0704]|uniref:NAD(+) diphosphatase n=1 Tax=Bifidobacterium sp. ESL0704 TaxID=2983219 RepID=UPI0023F7943C|nr:NAD(+) diphosphatase [Bifidobacterium sp. ESL0704]WEV52716.1 NAD(+) diphosphatase [Bifidobacterium sp. ESL0704]
MAASFSSLALTQMLPFLPLAQGDIDYQAERRSDPSLIADVLSRPSTTVIFVRDGLVAVPDGQAARVDFETTKMRLATVPGQYVLRAITRQAGTGADGSKVLAKGVAASEGDLAAGAGQTVGEIANRLGLIPIFLGSYGVGSERPQSVVALDVSVFADRAEGLKNGEGNPQAATANATAMAGDAEPQAGDAESQAGDAEPQAVNTKAEADDAGSPAVGVKAAAGDARSEASSTNPEADSQLIKRAGRNQILERALQRFDWVSLMGFAPHASAREAGEATTAASLSNWHRSQKHCPRCGCPVVPAMSGWAQRCTNEQCKAHRSPLFARIEPAVIVSIVDGHDRLLLQHNKAWKDPSHYSVCAGFVEAGESLEHAARREAAEETGLALGEVRYLGSQPWPFPGSLMVAFKARALGTDVKVDGCETLDARFLTRDEFTEALAQGTMAAPGKATVARYMIEEWYGREL